MTDVKRLLEAATPLPWHKDLDYFYDGNREQIGHTGECGAAWGHKPWGANARLILYAVNRLPDYEAAVDALERLVMVETEWPAEDYGERLDAIQQGKAALARLREI